MNNQIFQYNDNPITFQMGNGDVMVNATEMAQPFGKRPAKWLELPSTKEYITTLQAIRKSDRLVEAINGIGTWFHEDVTLEFARWLSPAFAIWCNDRIKELLKYGMTATQPTLESMLNNPDVLIGLATQLKTERAEKERLSEQNRLQTEQLQISAPKTKYYDEVLTSESTYNINQIAKELGLSATTLNKKLKDLKVQYKQGGQWLLTSKYQNKGYTKTRTHSFTHSDGKQATSMQTVWTEKGRAFIHDAIR